MSEENGTAAAVSFGAYGTSFQEKTFQALLADAKWAEQTLDVFNEDYFDLTYLRYLAGQYFSYARRYKVFPTLQLLITIIRDDLKAAQDAGLRSQVVEYLTRMKSNPDPGDLKYIKEKSLEFCRKQALKAALESAVDMIAAEKYEAIIETIKKAVIVGTTPSIGHDFFNEPDSRFVKLARNCVPTGIVELDKKGILNGGAGAGELLCIVGATGAGKSHFLTMIGCNALRSGKNVLHYTFELSETAAGIRYDSNLCDINSDDVIDNKEVILNAYSGMAGLGRLMIKYFPTNSATIHTLRAHVERLNVKGFTPDVVIIDYADIMRSTRQYDSLRHELKLIYQELRGYATELGIPVWTASQSNKEGANSDIIDLTNMSEAYGKAMEADVILSISRKSFEKATGNGRLFVAKNRAGRDGLVYPIKIDTARSKFEISGNVGTFEDAVISDETGIKAALREKWKELKKEPMFKPVADVD